MKHTEHPLNLVIDSFQHAIRDSEASARICIPISLKIVSERAKEALTKMDEHIKSDEDKPELRAFTSLEIDRTLRRMQRLSRTKLSERIEQSLFVGLFSVYDAFIGELLRTIIQRKPDILKGVGGSVSPSDIISAENLESLKDRILNQVVDDIRRKSYEDQFSNMEAIFGLPLKKFTSWPQFVESSQRRHLFTHCGGKVSQQYLSNCADVGIKPDPDASCVGHVLPIGNDYFMRTSQVVAEVGIKLGHTLWRKVFPEEIEIADASLSDLIFEYLKDEKWAMAELLGEFAKSQKKSSSKPREKIFTVNYCIALKFGGKSSNALDILNKEDWSDAAIDFRLAKMILLDQYDDACDLMRRIGRKGEYVSEEAYHIWPLFRSFRGNDKFRETYREIYGYDFLTEVKREASKSKDKTQEIIDKTENRTEPNKAVEPTPTAGTDAATQPPRQL